jgi:hypothetical protein
MREDDLTVHVPITFRRRGGRKLIVAPDGSAMPAIAPRFDVDNVLVKALARGFRWQKLLDRGTYSTIKEIATKERVDASYVGDVVRLTLWAPDIIEIILDGRQPPGLRFEQMPDRGRQTIRHRHRCLRHGSAYGRGGDVNDVERALAAACARVLCGDGRVNRSLRCRPGERHASFHECTRCFGRCAFSTRIRPARLGGAPAAVATDSVAAQEQGRGGFFVVKQCRAAHRRKTHSALRSAVC